MNTSNPVEIIATLTSPQLPMLPSGSPRLGIYIYGEVAGTKRLLAGNSSQCLGGPMPMRLLLDQQALASTQQLSLEARCSVGAGEDAVIARHTRTLDVDEIETIGSLDLILEAVDSAEESPSEQPLPPTVVTLTGQVNIPAELMQTPAYLDATLLVIQEDGRSNRYSSNIADHSLYIEGEVAPFTLYIDTATLPTGQQVKLHFGLYDLERKQLFAGNVIKNLDISNPPDLSDIVLRKPRH